MWNNCWANPHYDISWPLSKQLFSSSSHFTSTSAALVVAEILYQPVVTMVVHLRSVGSRMMPAIGKSTSKASDSNTTVFMLYTYTYAYIYIYTCIIYIYVYIYTYILYIYIYVYIYMCMCKFYLYVYTCIYIYAYALCIYRDLCN